MIKIFQFDDQKEFAANTYVLGKIGGGCIVIDLGSTDDTVINYIDSHYDKVVAVLLTHAHFDHIRGLTKFLKHYRGKSNIPVYLSSEDVPLLREPVLNTSTLMNEKVVVNVTTIPVQDGEELKLKDFHIRVIHTPFHTEGSVCYYLEDDNALFTGDTLFKGSVGRTDLPTGDSTKMRDSFEKIKALGDYFVIYPGHGPITRMDIEKRENPFLQNIE